MSDVTIHIDESLDKARLEKLRDILLHEAGVMAADYQKSRQHLMVVEFDPERNNSANLLKTVKAQGVHAELIGL
jgi:hypothetical protein